MARIVGGGAGGRRIEVPRGTATRPTAERTREGLFSALESMLGSLADRPFLDLYAGSGAVGLEAASRGAAPVRLVENASAALRVIRQNVAALALPRVEISGEPVERVLSGDPDNSYAVVFLDPPYAVSPVRPVTLLVERGWLAREAVVVVERATRDGGWEWPAGLVADRMRRYGDSTLWYGRRP
jgi:16S rRNA (guanine966-N2)-methyltransferase